MKHIIRQKPNHHFLPILLGIAMLAGCASHRGHEKSAQVAANDKTSEKGYLQKTALPDSLALLSAPPMTPGNDSPVFALDQDFSEKTFALRDTPAWTLATLDADLNFTNAAGTFSCALNAQISEQDTPHLYTLLRRTVEDAKNSTKAAKDHYKRLRPFQVNHQPLCTPSEQERLEKNGSYPSGHNAVGMTWALILAEISPELSNTILARGQAYGVSRMVCNVHWYSDTLQGRYLGAYTVAALHASPEFLHDLEAAKDELKAVRAKGMKPTRDCQAEKAGMDLQKTLF